MRRHATQLALIARSIVLPALQIEEIKVDPGDPSG
jgi:hypothetical protein